jgi:hypothetical protein
MSNDDTEKKEPPLPAIVDDGFAGWEDGVEGDDRPQGASVIQGTLIKFSNEAQWVTRDGEELPADLELVAVDVARVVQKWQDQQPVETIILEPHRKFPDIEQMNAETPKEEWEEGPDGQLRGPWQSQHILYSLNPKTMEKFTFPTGTTGGRIAIRDLRDKAMWMRRLRGPNVYPVVLLADVFMPTKWGGRQRPHFKIVRYVRLGGEGCGDVEALPPPTPPPAPSPASKEQEQLVQEPSLAEEMNDEIPDFTTGPANEPKGSQPRPTARRDLKKPTAKASAKASSRRRVSNLDAG